MEIISNLIFLAGKYSKFKFFQLENIPNWILPTEKLHTSYEFILKNIQNWMLPNGNYFESDLSSWEIFQIECFQPKNFQNWILPTIYLKLKNISNWIIQTKKYSKLNASKWKVFSIFQRNKKKSKNHSRLNSPESFTHNEKLSTENDQQMILNGIVEKGL